MSTYRTETVALDGGDMQLALWTPDVPPVGSVLLLQEIFGVGPYIRAVAERLAAEGWIVGAPDVFWRFAPGWEAAHDEAGLQQSIGAVQQLDVPRAIADCTAALGRLGELAAAEVGATATLPAPAVLGFCLGGTLAWGVAAAGEPSACVSYYGSGVPSMLDLIDSISCPTLLHFGNDDAYLPGEAIDAVAAALAGHPGFLVNVEDAGHAFDNHEAPMFWSEAAAKSAWAKTLAFLDAHAR